jgi:hypothetical protein
MLKEFLGMVENTTKNANADPGIPEYVSKIL